MKYKAGDRVIVKSLEWYNKNKDKDGLVFSINGTLPFSEKMAKYCGKDFEIEEIIHGDYVLSINDGSCFYFEDWMLKDI